MKSIRTNLIAACLMSAFLVLGSAQTQAQVPAKLNFALTAVYQEPSVVSGTNQNITKSSTKTLKVTSESLAGLLGLPPKTYFTLDIGGGGALAVGGVSSVSSGVATPEGSVTVALGSFVASGSTDSDKATANLTYTAYMTVGIDDGAGNAGTMSGLVKITDSIAALSHAQTAASSPATETVSFSGNLTGSGTVVGSDGNTDTAVFSGTVSGSAKAPTGT